ncbi:MAG: mechanosensitive ion channel family protein [Candidatus Anstonellales archaeon]
MVESINLYAPLFSLFSLFGIIGSFGQSALLSELILPIPGGKITTASLVALLIFLILDLIISIFLSAITKVAEKTKTDFDDAIVRLIKKRKALLLAVLSVFIAVQLFYGNIEIFSKTIFDWFLVFLIIYAGLIFSEMADLLFFFFIKNISTSKEISPEEIAPLARKVLKFIIIFISIIIALGQFGIEISPLIAGLGIGGLAVGLALQDTLSNFFSGIHILSDKPFRKGDYVIIGNTDGFVEEIGWRSTKIQKFNKNLIIIIPNKTITESVITNLGQENIPYVHTVNFSVGYGVSINKLRKIYNEIIKKLIEENFVIHDKNNKPELRLTNFGADGLEFTAVFPVPHYTKRFNTQSRFLELLYNRLAEENIDIPYPQRVIHIKDISEIMRLQNMKFEGNIGKLRKGRTGKR